MIKFCLQCQHLEMMVRNSHLVITGSWLLCNVILNLQNFSVPTNAMSERPAYLQYSYFHFVGTEKISTLGLIRYKHLLQDRNGQRGIHGLEESRENLWENGA